jgi:hypothetical protein
MALSSSSGGSVAHLRSDTVEQVSPAKLREVLSLVAGIVECLQDKPPGWTRQAQTTDRSNEGTTIS